MNNKSQARLGIQSVEVAATILKALAEGGGILPLKSLSNKAGMHPGKVHRYLTSLTRSGLVSQDPKSGHYYIGPSALAIGLTRLRISNPIREVLDRLPRLRDEVDETVCLAIWGDMGPTVIALEENSQPVTMNVRIGSIVPMMSSAIGQAFAAFMPQSITEGLLSQERSNWRGRQIPSKAQFSKMIAEIQQSGFSRVEGTLLAGISAVAAPVFEHRGRVSSVVCIVGRQGALDTSHSGITVQALLAFTREASASLGYLSNEQASMSQD